MNSDECSVCFEGFTPESGHTVLGCGHKFHLRCVVHWFQEQEGPSTCPCCRREAGHLDNVPLVEEGGDTDADEEDDGDSDWSGEEEEEEENVGELRPVWTWDKQCGVWERTWVVTGGSVQVWDPQGEWEPIDPPEEMTEGAVALQRIWRGWCVRRDLRQGLSQADVDAARVLVTLSCGEDSWLMQRFVRVD
jgi:hypothetical protein